METRNENVAHLAGKLVEVKKVWASDDLIICEGLLQINRDSGVSDYIPILFDNTLDLIKLDSFVDLKG